MPQDRAIGAFADKFGRDNARHLAVVLKAKLIFPTASNEALFRGKKTVLKSCKRGTTQVGVSYRMLEHLDTVIAAFEGEDGKWTVFELLAERFRREERETASRGSSAGKVGVVSKKLFQAQGEGLGTFALPTRQG